MWPKILIELIPHISRLVPTAEKFFNSRGATDEATQQAITALRSDLAQTASTHAGLYRQMNEQSERISQAADDAAATRAAVLTLDSRLAAVEQRSRLTSGLSVALLCLNVPLLVGVIVLLLRH